VREVTVTLKAAAPGNGFGARGIVDRTQPIDLVSVVHQGSEQSGLETLPLAARSREHRYLAPGTGPSLPTRQGADHRGLYGEVPG
jgi:hypothetical protein